MTVKGLEVSCATNCENKAVWGRYKHMNNERSDAMENKIMTKE